MLNERPIIDKECFDKTGDAIDKCEYLEPHEITISVIIIGGHGSVVSEQSGINCPTDCSEIYRYEEEITLVAVPDEFYGFKKWGRDYDVIDIYDPKRCFVVTNKNKTITAEFIKLPVLTVKVNNCGFVTTGNDYFDCRIHSEGNPTGIGFGINCPIDCSEIYSFNDVVTLYAIGTECCSFDDETKWIGCTVCDSTSCTVIMNEDKVITANFTLWSYLKVNISPTPRTNDDVGHVTSSDGKINCVYDCVQCYHPSSSVTLCASPVIHPPPGRSYNFVHWLGPGSFKSLDLCITITIGPKDVTYTAVFIEIPIKTYCISFRTDPAKVGNIDLYTTVNPPIVTYPNVTTFCKSSTVSTIFHLKTESRDVAKYTFDKWSTNVVPAGQECDTPPVFSSNISVIAYYKAVAPIPAFCLTVKTNPPNAGTIKVYTFASPTTPVINYPTTDSKCSTIAIAFHLETESRTPASYVFNSWSPNVILIPALPKTCDITITANTTVIANYDIIVGPHMVCLTVKSDPIGSGTIGAYTYASPTTPVITYPTTNSDCNSIFGGVWYYIVTESTDPAKYVFHSWSSNVDLIPASAQACNLTVTVNITVIAYFTDISPQLPCLIVVTDPVNVGTITSSTNTINYPSDDRECTNPNTTFTLTATSSDPAYCFDHWEGCSSSPPSTTICLTVKTVPANAGEIKVYAMFSPTPTIPVIEYPTSNKHCSPITIAYYLTTNALDPKYIFNRWSPNVTLIPASPQTSGITISSNITVIAYYTSFCITVITSPPNAGYIDVYTTSSPTPSVPVIAYPTTTVYCGADTYYLATHSIDIAKYTFDKWSTNVIPKPSQPETCDVTISNDITVTAYYITLTPPVSAIKYAVVVGINAYSAAAKINPLNGCIPDAMSFKNVILPTCGFKPSDIITLLDSQATKTNILNNLTAMVSKSKSGDTIFFSYSGHGSQVAANSGGESDNLDEILVYWTTIVNEVFNNPIRDQDLGRIMGSAPAGVNIIVLLDSCHSGTGVRDISNLEYRYTPPPDYLLPRNNVPIIKNTFSKAIANTSNQGDILLLAGCAEDQLSADAKLSNGTSAGAFSYALHIVLKKYSYSVSYNTLISETCSVVASNGFTQIPQLEGKQSLFSNIFLG
jgi:hypothetical protein